MREMLSLEEMLAAVDKVDSWEEFFNKETTAEYQGKFILKSGSEGKVSVKKEPDQQCWMKVELKKETIGFYKGEEAKPIFESVERKYKEDEEENERLEREWEDEIRISHLKKTRRVLFGKKSDGSDFTLEEALDVAKKIEIKFRHNTYDEYYAGTKKNRIYEAVLIAKSILKPNRSYSASISFSQKRIIDAILKTEIPKTESWTVVSFEGDKARVVFEHLKGIYNARETEIVKRDRRYMIREIRARFPGKSRDEPLNFEEIMGIAERIKFWGGNEKEGFKGLFDYARNKFIRFYAEAEGEIKYSGNVYFGGQYSFTFTPEEAEKVYMLARGHCEAAKRKLEEEQKPKETNPIAEFREEFAPRPEKLPLGRRLGR